MSQFSLALPTIFLHEGRYVANAKDPGGPTNFGISLRFLKTLGDVNHDGFLDGDINHDGTVNEDDIKKLDDYSAAEIYQVNFWAKYSYAKINHQSIATKLFDFSVNMGPKNAHLCLQRALRANKTSIIEDGILGKNTIDLCNSSEEASLLSSFKSEAGGFYRSIRYSGSEIFLKGWLNRAYSDPV